MNTIFERIVKIEKEACNVNDEATALFDKLPEQLKEEYHKIDTALQKENEQILKETSQKRQEELEKKCKQLDAQFAEKETLLKESFEKNAHKWQESIFSTVIR